MPQSKHVPTEDLQLDLENFRTVPQKKEGHSLRAMVSINPDWFWALTESLIEDGYHPTENIIVLKNGGKLVVKEGNRRIAALKLISGKIATAGLLIPGNIQDKIAAISEEWKTDNASVPCAIYSIKEAQRVDRIVALTHGKGDRAGRDKWTAVATARHNRDMAGASEPALDLLECYLKHGQNITAEQKARWSGVYPLSVLAEALKGLAPRMGVASSRELSDQYPNKTLYREALEGVLYDIGTEQLNFPRLRAAEDYGSKYGLPNPPKFAGVVSATLGAAQVAGANAPATGKLSATPGALAPPAVAKATIVSKGPYAVSSDDPRSVKRVLRGFAPKGKNREKVVRLLNEARALKLDIHPHSFCFLIRSIFELSAKAYCGDHDISAKKSDGNDKNLGDLLRDITKHLTADDTGNAKKALHGAIAELNKPAGFLSVTSLNQLVHNPSFSVDETHICTLFHNVFPLLEAMN